MATAAGLGLALAAAVSAGQGQRAESKRDKKRQLVLEKLAQLEDATARDQNVAYRDQLQKVSLEIGFVQRFDPYALDCLEKVAELRGEHSRAAAAAAPLSEAGRSLLDMAGPTFGEYLDLVEDAIEKRDFGLVEHKREHDAKLARLKHGNEREIQTAITEHDYLAGTIRDRLFNQITSRKNRLNKEKEALEISEASALLLHPNQFSIANPASPGGTHGKRATRTRRDAEDLSGLGDMKRKRNGDDDGSPAPATRAFDPTHTTSLWHSDKIRLHLKQNGSPVFSVEKLFTDKELAMTHNAAAVATHHNMLSSRVSSNDAEMTPEGSDSGYDGQEGSDKNAEALLAPTERQIPHATRSTRNVIDERNMGPETVANYEVPASLKRVFLAEPPKLPPFVAQPFMKPYPKTNEPMTTTPLPPEEIALDVSAYKIVKCYGASRRPGESLDNVKGFRDLLKSASMAVSEARYQTADSQQEAPISDLRCTLIRSSLNSVGVPLSRQSSVGIPMSRQDSGRGRGRGR